MAQAKTITPDPAASAKAKELDDMRTFYKKEAKKMYEVTCTNHGGVIAIEVEMPNIPKRRGHVEGLIVVPVDEQLLSYRTRTDGTMGYSCACGVSNILLLEEQGLQKQDMSLPHVKAEINRRLGIVGAKNKSKNDKAFTRAKVK